jgi:sarcosine oxidase delta subunit
MNDPFSKVRDFTFSERNWHDQRAHTRMVRWKNYAYMRNNRRGLLGFNLSKGFK